jgi:hypothetical protein
MQVVDGCRLVQEISIRCQKDPAADLSACTFRCLSIEPGFRVVVDGSELIVIHDTKPAIH